MSGDQTQHQTLVVWYWMMTNVITTLDADVVLGLLRPKWWALADSVVLIGNGR